METALARYDVEGKVPTRTGDCHPSLAPFETFQAEDEKFVIAAGNDQLFLLMADALGAPELAMDPDFSSNDLRVRNRPKMVAAIDAVTSKKPVQHWLDELNEVGVPCGPINTIVRILDHPQLLARNMIVQFEGKSAEPFRTAGNPIKLSAYNDMGLKGSQVAPALNQHREDILAEVMADAEAYNQNQTAKRKDDVLASPWSGIVIFGLPQARV